MIDRFLSTLACTSAVLSGTRTVISLLWPVHTLISPALMAELPRAQSNSITLMVFTSAV
jgi:hypothetical protein